MTAIAIEICSIYFNIICRVTTCKIWAFFGLLSCVSLTLSSSRQIALQRPCALRPLSLLFSFFGETQRCRSHRKQILLAVSSDSIGYQDAINKKKQRFSRGADQNAFQLFKVYFVHVVSGGTIESRLMLKLQFASEVNSSRWYLIF